MKTSTLLMLGGAAALGYYLATRKSDAATASLVASETARLAPAPPATQVVVQIPDNYQTVNYQTVNAGWSWGPPVLVRGGGGGRGGGWSGGHHGGHGHGGHH